MEDPVLGRVTVAPPQSEGQSWGEYRDTVLLPLVREMQGRDKTPEQRRDSDRRRKERLVGR